MTSEAVAIKVVVMAIVKVMVTLMVRPMLWMPISSKVT